MIGLSDGVSVALTAFSVLAAVGTAVTGFMVARGRRVADALSIGQTSITEALAWADKNNAQLRKTIDVRVLEFEDHKVGCSKEIVLLKQRATSAEARLDAAEQREASCLERLAALVEQVKELQKR